MLKRIFLFLVMNIAVLALISIIFSVFNIAPYIGAYGLNYQSLLIYAAVIGFAGSFISLAMSKWMAKSAYNIHLIDVPQGAHESLVHRLVQKHANAHSLPMPEVGIYHSPEPNAFATGASKRSSLVAVSSGLIENMTEDELEGVIAHEVAHIANGDMVTMTLLQGILNTFVIFLARVAAYAITTFSSDEEGNSAFGSIGYFVVSIVLEIAFGILASMVLMAFSRHREFRADAGSARSAGASKMIAALEKLKKLSEIKDPREHKSFATMQIADNHKSFISLFASHPSLDDRIKALHRGV